MKQEIERYKDSLAGKRILVVGMGRSGKAAVQELIALGARVEVQDIHTAESMDPRFLAQLEQARVAQHLGSVPSDMSVYHLVVLSPGVDPELDFLQEARRQQVEVIGELELAYRVTHGRFIAITGTNGKTTTTTLVGRILEESGCRTAVVGNIGVAAVSQAMSSTDDEYLVTETSSFQLETTTSFAPAVAAILNLSPDHLDRHRTMDGYIRAKAAVTSHQQAKDVLVYNRDDAICREIAASSAARGIPFSLRERLDIGCYLEGERLLLRDEQGTVQELCRRSELRIPGEHNVANVLAAAAIAYWSAADIDSIRRAVCAFPGVEHRIEYSGKVDGVSYYNDSKGTNVDAAITALRALQQGIFLIAGGDGKGQDFSALAEALAGRVKGLILLGRDADQIAAAAEAQGFTKIYREKDMNDCVKHAAALAEPGDRVLLSPACASWDMYSNYEQRGQHFKACVQQLLS